MDVNLSEEITEERMIELKTIVKSLNTIEKIVIVNLIDNDLTEETDSAVPTSDHNVEGPSEKDVSPPSTPMETVIISDVDPHGTDTMSVIKNTRDHVENDLVDTEEADCVSKEPFAVPTSDHNFEGPSEKDASGCTPPSTPMETVIKSDLDPHGIDTLSVIKNTRDHVENDLVDNFNDVIVSNNNCLENNKKPKVSVISGKRCPTLVLSEGIRASDKKLLKSKKPSGTGRTVACKMCPKIFPSKYKLKMHEKSHLDIKTKEHVCEFCHKNFTRRDNLNKHKKLYHTADTIQENKTVDQAAFKCNVCPKSFTIKKYLLRHKLTHETAKFDCSKCGKTFAFGFKKNQHELKCDLVKVGVQSRHHVHFASEGDKTYTNSVNINDNSVSSQGGGNQYGVSMDNPSFNHTSSQWVDAASNQWDCDVSNQYGDLGYQYMNGCDYNKNTSAQYFNMTHGDMVSGHYASIPNSYSNVYNPMQYPYAMDAWEGFL